MSVLRVSLSGDVSQMQEMQVRKTTRRWVRAASREASD